NVYRIHRSLKRLLRAHTKTQKTSLPQKTCRQPRQLQKIHRPPHPQRQIQGSPKRPQTRLLPIRPPPLRMHRHLPNPPRRNPPIPPPPNPPPIPPRLPHQPNHLETPAHGRHRNRTLRTELSVLLHPLPNPRALV